MLNEFVAFPKIPRLKRDCVITEKIDGTNASIHITPEGEFLVGSRTRFITPESDNFGFAAWAYDHKDELMKLGPGRHYGEWWGSGIQRGYGLTNGERRFSLFNAHKAHDHDGPNCVGFVPVLYQGPFNSTTVDVIINDLKFNGSHVQPGFMKPEGIVIYHAAARSLFKVTVDKDDAPKGKSDE